MIGKIIAELTHVVAFIFKWFDPNTHRKNKAETMAMEIENAHKVLKMYREIIEDMNQQNKQLREEFQQKAKRSMNKK